MEHISSNIPYIYYIIHFSLQRYKNKSKKSIGKLYYI
nr:MAG TPA: hypothetical protein [Caudoviricetes sp.]